MEMMHQEMNVRHFLRMSRTSTAIPILNRQSQMMYNIDSIRTFDCKKKQPSYPKTPANGQLRKAEDAVAKIARGYCCWYQAPMDARHMYLTESFNDENVSKISYFFFLILKTCMEKLDGRKADED